MMFKDWFRMRKDIYLKVVAEMENDNEYLVSDPDLMQDIRKASRVCKNALPQFVS